MSLQKFENIQHIDIPLSNKKQTTISPLSSPQESFPKLISKLENQNKNFVETSVNRSQDTNYRFIKNSVTKFDFGRKNSTQENNQEFSMESPNFELVLENEDEWHSHSEDVDYLPETMKVHLTDITSQFNFTDGDFEENKIVSEVLKQNLEGKQFIEQINEAKLQVIDEEHSYELDISKTIDINKLSPSSKNYGSNNCNFSGNFSSLILEQEFSINAKIKKSTQVKSELENQKNEVQSISFNQILDKNTTLSDNHPIKSAEETELPIRIYQNEENQLNLPRNKRKRNNLNCFPKNFDNKEKVDPGKLLKSTKIVESNDLGIDLSEEDIQKTLSVHLEALFNKNNQTKKEIKLKNLEEVIEPKPIQANYFNIKETKDINPNQTINIFQNTNLIVNINNNSFSQKSNNNSQRDSKKPFFQDFKKFNFSKKAMATFDGRTSFRNEEKDYFNPKKSTTPIKIKPKNSERFTDDKTGTVKVLSRIKNFEINQDKQINIYLPKKVPIINNKNQSTKSVSSVRYSNSKDHNLIKTKTQNNLDLNSTASPKNLNKPKRFSLCGLLKIKENSLIKRNSPSNILAGQNFDREKKYNVSRGSVDKIGPMQLFIKPVFRERNSERVMDKFLGPSILILPKANIYSAKKPKSNIGFTYKDNYGFQKYQKDILYSNKERLSESGSLKKSENGLNELSSQEFAICSLENLSEKKTNQIIGKKFINFKSDFLLKKKGERLTTTKDTILEEKKRGNLDKTKTVFKDIYSPPLILNIEKKINLDVREKMAIILNKNKKPAARTSKALNEKGFLLIENKEFLMKVKKGKTTKK